MDEVDPVGCTVLLELSTRTASRSIDHNVNMHVSLGVISHIMHFPSICHFPPSFNIDAMRGRLGCADKQDRYACGSGGFARAAMLQSQTKTTVHRAW